MTKRPSDEAISFEAVKTSIRQDKHGYALVLAIHPDDVPDALLRCWVGARFQVAMVQLGDDGQPIPLDKTDKTVKFSADFDRHAVALAGELCRTREFQNWIGQPNETEAAWALRRSLQVSTRTTIGANQEVKERFYDLLKQYQQDTGLLSPAVSN